jgi:hypothetical protein
MKKTIRNLLILLVLLAAPLVAHAGEYFNESLSSTLVQISSGSCKVYGYKITNPNGVPIYVHFYNAASASVTLGTTTQVDMVPVPANGAVIIAPNGAVQKYFDTALTIAATTSPLFSGTTAPTTGLVITLNWN